MVTLWACAAEHVHKSFMSTIPRRLIEKGGHMNLVFLQRGYALDSTTSNILWFLRIKMGRRELHELYTRPGNYLLLSHAQV